MKKFALFTVKILSRSKLAARKWFARFRAGNFDVKDESRSGQPITEKPDEIMVRVERDKHCGDCQGTKHRPQNSFKSFTQSWKQKEVRCLGFLMS